MTSTCHHCPPYQRQASESLWKDKILLSITHGELMSTDFQQALYDAVAAFVAEQEHGRIHRHAAELDRGARCRTMTATSSDGPLFLVVTIKPRLDRLARGRGPAAVDAPEHPEASRGACSCISFSPKMIRTRG